jgi:anti-sigma-K factor RskA
LIADPSGASGVLIVSELVPLAENQVYQVWLIAGQTPVSAGLLQVDEQGRGVVIVAGRAAISGYDALGVSIEPSGGSVAPTGEIVILSELG